jgi:hypothetical protein
MNSIGDGLMKTSFYGWLWVSFLVLVGISAPANSKGLRDGRWDLTAQVNTMGLPIKIPEQKTTMCVDRLRGQGQSGLLENVLLRIFES